MRIVKLNVPFTDESVNNFNSFVKAKIHHTMASIKLQLKWVKSL